MKVKELNALLNKLSKANPEQEITMGVPSPFGVIFDQPAVREGQDGAYIIPEGAEELLKEECNRESVGKCLTEWQQQQQQG